VSILRKSSKRLSARRQIDIKGAQDSILLLPGNQYRAVLKLSSINFELKSEAEQDALISAYQTFINSLACPLQIIVRIRELDMDKYLEGFASQVAEEQLTTYKAQILNYTEFVRTLVSTNKILARHFYVVVPLESKEGDFGLVKDQLTLQCDIVAKGLSKLGVHTSRLTSLEILDLFYSFYSPAQAKRQPLTTQMLTLINNAEL